MAAMFAIKPKAVVTEAFFTILTSKIMAHEWAAVPHTGITGQLQWEAGAYTRSHFRSTRSYLPFPLNLRSICPPYNPN